MVYLLQGFTFGIYAAAQPGPLQAFLLSQTLKNGWRRTLPAALAPLISDGPIIALVVVILTRTPGWFLAALQLTGGLFLLYLAKGSFEAATIAQQDIVATQVEQDSGHESLLKATVMNTLNPNPYIFWSIIGGPILLEAWQRSAGLGVGFIAGMYGTLVVGTALLIVIFATTRRMGPRVAQLLSAVSAVALLLFGLYQIWSALAA